MRMRLLKPLIQIALVAIMVVGLATQSLHHAESPLDQAAMESFVLAGGDPSGVCGDEGGTHEDCGACILAAFGGFDRLAVATPWMLLGTDAPGLNAIPNQLALIVRDPGLGLRAPPVA